MKYFMYRFNDTVNTLVQCPRGLVNFLKQINPKEKIIDPNQVAFSIEYTTEINSMH